MKTVTNFKIYTILTVCILFTTSCEKSELNPEPIDQNSSIAIEDDSSKDLEPVLHMSFNKDLSEAEASAEFDKAVAEYKLKNQNKSTSTEIWYRVNTLTGAQTNNGTDGKVRAHVYFYTDNLTHNFRYVLNNPDNDREENQWDYYLLRGIISSNYPPIEWVKLKSARIELKGTDGWFIKKFNVHILYQDQTAFASGESKILSNPNRWLDNDSSSSWDSYYTGNNSGVGTLFY